MLRRLALAAVLAAAVAVSDAAKAKAGSRARHPSRRIHSAYRFQDHAGEGVISPDGSGPLTRDLPRKPETSQVKDRQDQLLDVAAEMRFVEQRAPPSDSGVAREGPNEETTHSVARKAAQAHPHATEEQKRIMEDVARVPRSPPRFAEMSGRAQAKEAAEAKASEAIAAAQKAQAQAQAQAGAGAQAGAKAGAKGPANGWMWEHRASYPFGGQGYHYIPSQFRHPPPPPPAPIPPPPPPPQFGTANQPYQVYTPPRSMSFKEQGATLQPAGAGAGSGAEGMRFAEQGASAQETARQAAEAALRMAGAEHHPHTAGEAAAAAAAAAAAQGGGSGGLPASTPPPPPQPMRAPAPPGAVPLMGQL